VQRLLLRLTAVCAVCDSEQVDGRLTKTVDELSVKVSAARAAEASTASSAEASTASSAGGATDSGQGGGTGKRGMLGRKKKG
jgi:hypothetical protein